MSFTKDMKNLFITIIGLVVASMVIMVISSIGRIDRVDARVDSIENSIHDNTIKLNKIGKQIDDIHWFLIKKNDKINRGNYEK